MIRPSRQAYCNSIRLEESKKTKIRATQSRSALRLAWPVSNPMDSAGNRRYVRCLARWIQQLPRARQNPQVPRIHGVGRGRQGQLFKDVTDDRRVRASIRSVETSPAVGGGTPCLPQHTPQLTRPGGRGTEDFWDVAVLFLIVHHTTGQNQDSLTTASPANSRAFVVPS